MGADLLWGVLALIGAGVVCGMILVVWWESLDDHGSDW
jgi:hypothetical protein